MSTPLSKHGVVECILVDLHTLGVDVHHLGTTRNYYDDQDPLQGMGDIKNYPKHRRFGYFYKDAQEKN